MPRGGCICIRIVSGTFVILDYTCLTSAQHDGWVLLSIYIAEPTATISVGNHPGHGGSYLLATLYLRHALHSDYHLTLFLFLFMACAVYLSHGSIDDSYRAWNRRYWLSMLARKSNCNPDRLARMELISVIWYSYWVSNDSYVPLLASKYNFIVPLAILETRTIIASAQQAYHYVISSGWFTGWGHKAWRYRVRCSG